MSASLPFSLATLRSHAIFVPPASSSTDDGWELVDGGSASGSSAGLPAPKSARIAVRDKDLLVAFGREVRISSLSQAWEVHDGAVGSYKTLKSPHLTFPIHQIVVNPTGRLLAVVGHHQIVILVLPRSGVAGAGDVACRSFIVDEFQHSASSTTALTKVHWHQWGEGGNSLWVLAADGKLFEYDVLRPQSPVQTLPFLQEKTASTSKFSLVDPLSQYATSFAFSSGLNFGPLMVYALMANGDMYTMGPVLPLQAEVPATYLQSLQAWMSEKERRLASDDGSAEHAALVGRTALQKAWVAALVAQVQGVHEPPRRGYGLHDSSPPTPDTRPPPPPGLVRVHPPHLSESGGPAPGMHRALVRQGPLLVDPEPEEARNGDDMDEDMATDLVILSVTDSDGGKATKPDGEKGAESDADSKEEKAPESEPVNVFAIAWAGGRVDLGVEIHPTEPRWISSRDPAEEALVMSVIESVLVPFPAGTDEALNAPMFVPDPIHPAVVYLQHAFGVNAISVQPWAAQLLSGGELKPTDVACLVQASPSKPIVGMVTFCNITLGYGLLALATTGQLGAVELDFRVQDTGLAVQSTPIEETEADTQSLLSSPFDVDALLANIEKTAFNPRAAVRKLPDAGKPLTTIGPEHVRALAEVSDQVGARALAIGKASADTEARLDLALTEYRRQLGVLRAASQGITDVRSRAAANAERTASMAAAQAALGARLDAVLAALLAEYRPEIGAVERAWFDELERLRARIQGSGGLGRRPAPGMAQRSQVLREQLAVVTPLAKGLNKGDEDGQYGNRQLKPLRAALDGRSDELARMMRRVEALSIRVGEEDVEDEEEREDQ